MNLPFNYCLLSLSFIGSVMLQNCCPVMDETAVPTSGEEISFIVDDNSFATKRMMERTSITAFNTLAVGQDNRTLVDNVITAKNGNLEVLPGKYWPSDGTLSFYGILPAVEMTNTDGYVSFPVGSSSSKLNGTEDYVFAYRRNVSYATSPVNLTFNHILGCIDNFKATGSTADATTTINSITVSCPRSGTYQCSGGTESWSGLGTYETVSLPISFASASHPAGSDRIEGKETGTVNSSFSMIPGTYTIRIRYSVKYGNISRNYDKTGSVNLGKGKKSNISVILANDLSDLDFSTSVVDWENGNLAGEWREDFRAPKWYDIQTNGGQWYKTPNTLADNASEYDGFYMNENTLSEKSLNTITITWAGYESFSFKLHVSYTGNYQRGVVVSGLDEDLLSRMPVSNSTGANYYWEMYSSGIRLSECMYIGTSGSNADINSYKTYTYSGLDPSKTYSVQIIAVNCGGNWNGVNSTLIIPKNQ